MPHDDITRESPFHPPPERRMRDQDDVHFKTTKWERKLFDQAAQDMDLASTLARGESRFGAFAPITRELFATMYDPGDERATVEQGGTEWAAKAHQAARSLPDFDRLVSRTSGNTFASTLAADCLANALLDVLPGEQQDNPEDLQRDREALEEGEHFPGKGEALERIDGLIEKAKAQGQAIADGIDDAEGKVRRAVRKAVAKATEAIDEAEAAANAFGYGSGTASKGSSGQDKAALAARLRGNPKLRRIAELAGRFINIAQRKQRTKSEFAREEVADVEVGAEIPQLLPAELARLVDVDLELSFLADYSERKLMQYRMTGQAEAGKGPIVLCLDESGSMRGDREVWCKAIFLALMEVAKRQKRAAALIHFCGSTSRVDVFAPGKFTANDVMDAAEHFTGGGTSFEAPLRTAQEVIDRKTGGFDKADVIFVTDGSASPVGPWWDAYRKEKGVTCYGIAVDGATSHALTALSDEVISVSDITKGGTDETAVVNTLFNL
jgi:uncharacterized protein with von Willebrand factor type A (vWA) domain